MKHPIQFYILILFTVLTGLVYITGCVKDDGNCDPYYDCMIDKPDSANLSISISINSENPSIPIVIYKGDIEDKNILGYDTLSANSSYYLRIDKYTVTAKYRRGSDIIIAVDAVTLSSTTRDWNCGHRCFTDGDGTADCKLRK